MEDAVDAHVATPRPKGAGASAGTSGAATQAQVTICTDTFLLASSRCPNTVEIDLDPALVPDTVCQEH